MDVLLFDALLTLVGTYKKKSQAQREEALEKPK